ncbi:hypothetical protein [Aequorivita antarctica]|uniref:YtkA-like domain-containing protein n=1 Tax=Aequorivita antarctica TaxID=153266 RepID=A0A5C6YXQ4_9FLAO|nr:hypothetical protein [Aequorivita antarctica]TXD72388.1 hypothetical protein ESU54_13300 [Aequorivita antarctica]SRX74535.1 hypothetical protein AEQU3_01514 [Aequorivita antarctica]
MKTLKYIFAILILSISFVSCSDDDNDTPVEVSPVEGLNKIYEFSEADHSVEIYSEKTGLEVGYNEVSIRIKDMASNKYVTNAAPTWMPMMHMETMSHSAPHTMLSNSEESTVYKGYIVFQMASNGTEYWEVMLNYNLNGQAIEEAMAVSVAQPADGLNKTQVFTGSDNTRYILAYVNPKDPKVAINDLQAVLYKMETMMSFPVVENFKITVDPRMPGMGNHTSPNNQDLIYNAATKIYNGKLSLTMTGYWKINLKLMNESGEVLKGEDVTELNPESSLYFEIEF